ncbi:hypothetical protein [Flavobacterium humi]|uniref:Uncharacterized protein n=1 Tax=Flavobacterium humi TaxID=2562683 RepID=A0A4Z0LCP1_9FLAO|nr:hypothetical protein [Flavobacterium humi]TGD59656.1 hypothetical protein E4635_01615 [Flavobacterium humi]
MLKNILKLDGAKELSKNEQKSINGKGGDLLACRCDNGQLVVGHADNCKQLTDAFCPQES